MAAEHAVTDHNISVDLVSLEKKEWSGSARSISAPSLYGQVGILYGHTPLLSVLRKGIVSIVVSDGQTVRFEVSKAVATTSADSVRLHDLSSGDPEVDDAPGFLSVDGNLVTVVADVITPIA